MDPHHSISCSLCPEMLLVHVISFEPVTLKCADLHFNSTNSYAVVSVLGSSCTPYVFLFDFLFYQSCVQYAVQKGKIILCKR
jgi:hypothetical protein